MSLSGSLASFYYLVVFICGCNAEILKFRVLRLRCPPVRQSVCHARRGTPGIPRPAPAPAVPAPPVLVTNTGNSNSNSNSNSSSVAAVPAVPANPPPLRVYLAIIAKPAWAHTSTRHIDILTAAPHPTVVMPNCCFTLLAMLKTRLVAAPRFPRFGVQGFP